MGREPAHVPVPCAGASASVQLFAGLIDEEIALEGAFAFNPLADEEFGLRQLEGIFTLFTQLVAVGGIRGNEGPFAR